MHNASVKIMDGFPMTISFQDGSRGAFSGWYSRNKGKVDECLLTQGAVRFRHLSIDSTESFEQYFDEMAGGFKSYTDGNSPRTKLSEKVYTSTEYDSDQRITLHNELSYTNRWPSRLFFSCIIPATSGGETSIADGRKVLRDMDPSIVRNIMDRGLRYVRNLPAKDGFEGKSWQRTFETESRSAVEQYCHDADTQFTWKADGGLKLVQLRKGTATHPVTGEQVWFNQVDQFHPSQMPAEIAETLSLLYPDPEDLPINVTYGDLGKIESSVITAVHDAVNAHTIADKWEKGDLLVVDNLLTMHGRMPYKGDRKVLVAMC